MSFWLVGAVVVVALLVFRYLNMGDDWAEGYVPMLEREQATFAVSHKLTVITK